MQPAQIANTEWRRSRIANTMVGNASQGSVRSCMLAWRLHKFGPPEEQIWTAGRDDFGEGFQAGSWSGRGSL
jgi:hypothetical protein